MQKTFNFFYAFLLALLGFGVTLMAEDITLTTYYPAPYGAYDELTTTGNTYLATTSGNVGIGTTDPKTKLHVGGYVIIGSAITSANYELEVNERAHFTDAVTGRTTTDGLVIGANGAGNIFVVSNELTNLNFGTGGRNDIIISGTGKVGIGMPPTYQLDVAGDINTTGDVRKSGSAYVYPDYVFEPGYSLMPISELGSYVLENKHLPNMPSTEDIKQSGVQLFEQNRLLLEKIEEAHLYIIELEKRIEKLERR